MRTQIAADIPFDLLAADEALTRYGRWAADRHRRHRCGSAEGMYRADGWEANERRRVPALVGLAAAEAMASQRALARVAEDERRVLAILYVPNRLPPEAQLRIARIAPSVSCERHLRGLRMFWNIRRIMEAAPAANRQPAPSAVPEEHNAQLAPKESRARVLC